MSFKYLLDEVYPHFLRFLLDERGSVGDDGGDGDDGDDDGDDDDGDDGDEKDKDRGDRKMIDMDDLKGKKDDGDEDDPEKKEDDPEKKEIAERPDDVPEKFWDAKKGEFRQDAILKSYKDLEAKVGEKKAPDEYKIELNEDLQKIFHEETAEKDPLLLWFKGYAKENNFSQEMFNGALEGFAESAGEFMAENTPPDIDPKAEIEKLGKNGQAIVNNHVEFLSGMFKRGEFSEDEMQEVLILTETADGVKALGKLRAHYGEKQNIPLDLEPGGGAKSAEELQKMIGSPKYGRDSEYTAMVDKEYVKKYGSEPAGESRSSPL